MTTTPIPGSIPEYHGITPQIFADEIQPRGEPVVLRGAATDWPLCKTAAQGPAAAGDYLSRFDTGRPIETIFGDPSIRGRFFYNDDLSGLNFEKLNVAFRDALRELVEGIGTADARTVYIQSVPAKDHFPGLAAENRLGLLSDAIEPRIWIGGALSVQTHFDLSENIAVVAGGRRTFTLFPPSALPDLYPGPFEMTLAGPPVSMVRLENPDLARYPRFPKALEKAQRADLGPGDAIYIPYFWWHHVQSHEPFNVLINYWWNDTSPDLGSPFDALLHSIIAVRDLPDRQRDVWRRMFEYYVFKTHGDPVAHLPERARGALGPHDQETRLRLWAMLTNAVGSHTARLRQAFRPGPKR